MTNILRSTKEHMSGSFILSLYHVLKHMHAHSQAHTYLWIFNRSNYLGSRFCVVNILRATKKYKFTENTSLTSVKKISRLK